MTLLSDVITASARLHNPAQLSNDEYDHRIREVVEYFKQLLTTKALEPLASDESFLPHFDPAIDSLPYLFGLHLQIQKAQNIDNEEFPRDIRPMGKLWTHTARFLRTFNRVQVRYAAREWRQLLELVGGSSQAASMPLLGATVLKDAMLRLDPSCSVFTSTHLMFIRLCLKAKAYSCALPVLNKQIYHLPVLPERHFPISQVLCAEHGSGVSFITEKSGFSSVLSYRDYLRYFLYGSMVYMALKEWHNALHLLGIVISVPSVTSVSMIMVEAYKKWVLVGLLEKGKLCSPPGITTPHVVKVFQSLAKPYVILAHAFELGDLNRLKAESEAAREVWCMDNNLGLVSQVVDVFFSQKCVRLGKTFAALTVTDLANQVFPSPVSEQGTEAVVSSFIMSGVMNATMVHTHDHNKSSILRFAATQSTAQLSHELDLHSWFKDERRLMGLLLESLRETNNNLGLSDEYVDSLHRGQVWSGSNDVNAIVGEEAGLEMDEDLMGDMS